MSATMRLNDPKYLQLHVKGNGNVADMSGNKKDGAWTGTVAYVQNAFGHQAMDFPGGAVDPPANMVTVATDAALRPTVGTVSFWGLMDTNFDHRRAVCQDVPNTTNKGWEVVCSTNANIAYARTGHATGYSELQWAITQAQSQVPFHVAFSWSGTVLSGYLNGLLIATAVQSGAISYNTANAIRIGGGYTTNNFNGSLWNVRLYSCLLTGDEVWSLFQHSKR